MGEEVEGDHLRNKKTFEGVYKDNLSTMLSRPRRRARRAHAALARAVSSA